MVDSRLVDLLPFRVFDLMATYLWSVTSAAIGIARGYDLVGVALVAFVSSLGGGLLRDGLFLQAGPPMAVRDPAYSLLVVLGACTASVPVRRFDWRRNPRLVEAAFDGIDAVGLGAYACVGAELSLAAGLSTPAALLVGTFNAVGGGLLRDVITRREPAMLFPGHPQVVVALLGSSLYLGQVVLGANRPVAAGLSVLTAALLRLLALRRGWRTTAFVVEGAPSRVSDAGALSDQAPSVGRRADPRGDQRHSVRVLSGCAWRRRSASTRAAGARAICRG